MAGKSIMEKHHFVNQLFELLHLTSHVSNIKQVCNYDGPMLQRSINWFKRTLTRSYFIQSFQTQYLHGCCLWLSDHVFRIRSINTEAGDRVCCAINHRILALDWLKMLALEIDGSFVKQSFEMINSFGEFSMSIFSSVSLNYSESCDAESGIFLDNEIGDMLADVLTHFFACWLVASVLNRIKLHVSLSRRGIATKAFNYLRRCSFEK